MNCKHQFETIELRTKIHPNNNSSSTVYVPRREVYGTRAGCILCGEIRTVWADGELEIEIKKNV